MPLVAQWKKLADQFPDGWEELRLRLVPSRPEQAARAAKLLGALGPGLAGDAIYVTVSPGAAQGRQLFERLLSRLDDEGIDGTLGVATVGAHTHAAEATPAETGALADAWDRLVSGLPEDWSDLLCLVEFRSSDDLAPASLALAPLNPSRHGDTLGFRFRVAHRFGYGAAPEMARRCLARLDEQGIRGRLSLLDARADTRPVLTQGPTFVVGNRAV